MSGRLNGETIKKMNQNRNYKYNMLEKAKKEERKPTLGPRQTAINMVKEGKSFTEIRKKLQGYSDKVIIGWLEEELTKEEFEKFITADIAEDIIKKTIKKRINMYIERGFDKDKIPYYITKSKVIGKYTNFKTREDLEAYIKQIMDEEEQKNGDER